LVLIAILIFNKNFVKADYPDSLRQVIANQEDNRQKLDNIISLAKYYLQNDMDSLKKYGEFLYLTAERLNEPGVMAQSDIYLGSYYKSIDDFEKSLDYYLKAFHVADSVNDTIRIAKASLNAGTMLTKLSKDTEARGYYKQSLENFNALHDSGGIVACYNNLGLSFSQTSAFDSAAYYYDKGLIMSEKTRPKYYLGSLYYNLGEVYKELEDYEKAQNYAVKSIEIYAANKDKRGIALANNTLGNIYQVKRDFQKSLEHYKIAEEILLQTGDSLHLYDVYNNLGVLYQDQKNYPVAINYFAKALKGYRKLGYIRGIIFVLGNQGTILAELGKPREAIKIQDSVVYLANKFGYAKNRKDALYNIYLDFYDLADYKDAIDYQTRYSNLKDSIFNMDKEELINDLKFKYEKEKESLQSNWYQEGESREGAEYTL